MLTDQNIDTEKMNNDINNSISINQGFLYAQEVVIMATKQKKKLCLFKEDLYKAFDTLSWNFLEQVMQAKGFS
jgi:hypothetical protein